MGREQWDANRAQVERNGIPERLVKGVDTYRLEFKLVEQLALPLLQCYLASVDNGGGEAALWHRFYFVSFAKQMNSIGDIPLQHL